MLDSALIYQLREVINKTNIFVQDSIEMEKFNLICAVMDRFDNSIKYLNNHQKLPQNEKDIIIYLHHCCIIKDGINEVCKMLKINVKQTKILLKYAISSPINQLEEKYKGDDKFFEYLRSLFFAHPFITDRSIPNPIKNEIQYSLYILNGQFPFVNDMKNSIEVMVYSNKRNTFRIGIKFNDLKKYIYEKFLLINSITASFQKIIDNKIIKWKKRKVNRHQSVELVLQDIIDIFNERYINSSDIETIYDYLTCNITNKENKKIVDQYIYELKEIIPIICDCVDEMDYKRLECTIYDKINPHIKEKYPMMNYQIGKIYTYLNYDDFYYIQLGLKMAESFSKGFAKNWVIIEPYNMDYNEIKLLVTIACYYESKKDGEKK